MRRLKNFAAASLVATLAACGGETTRQPGIVVEPIATELTVSAVGELVASESLPVALPPGIRMGFNIAWMAPEFSEVKKGDVVARFDETQIVQTRRSTATAVAKSDFQLADISRVGALEQIRIDHESERVDGERDITETFANVDQRLLSRNEVIDALSDVDYLNVEAAFLEWQWETFDQRTQAERAAIQSEQEGEREKLAKQDQALSMMELRSPADGTFVYASTPWGAKLGKGKRVFPGMPVGLLPVRGKVRVQLFVAEADAVGLGVDQPVRFRLDAVPNQQFNASITSVSAVATPLKRGEPQKYFTVEAEIEDIDAEVMRVGSKLRGEIITGQLSAAIVVPTQAVFAESDATFVYIDAGGSTPQRRDIQIGARGPDILEVESGLEPGDRVLLVAPINGG
ncbi:MAG: HlyD family efflux transporter periplasmic adaptor subunit [Pseudomonadota bacterium]